MLARKTVMVKKENRDVAVTHIQRVARGKQARKKVREINDQRRKMGLGDRRHRQGDQHFHKQDGDGEESDGYGSSFDEEKKPPTEEEAALILQSAGRGLLGRRKAKKQVRPFELSIAGFDFTHRGGQKTVGEAGVLEAHAALRKRATVGELTQLMLLNNPDEEELSIFRIIDADGDGFINQADLSEYLQKIGERGHGPIELKVSHTP